VWYKFTDISETFSGSTFRVKGFYFFKDIMLEGAIFHSIIHTIMGHVYVRTLKYGASLFVLPQRKRSELLNIESQHNSISEPLGV
jgi:hypothetical protein